MSEPHERLDRAMRERSLQIRKRWVQIASEAGISTSALSGIRRGEYRPSPLTARALEDAFGWAHGSIEEILAGGEPTPIKYLSDSATARDELDVERTESPVEAQMWREIRRRIEADPRLGRLVLEILRYGRRPPEPGEPGESGEDEDQQRDAG